MEEVKENHQLIIPSAAGGGVEEAKLIVLEEENGNGNGRGKLPLECSTCPKTFMNPIDLQVHIRLHTGEKPYRCRTCGEKFIHYTYLQDHIKTTHDRKRKRSTSGPKAKDDELPAVENGNDAVVLPLAPVVVQPEVKIVGLTSSIKIKKLPEEGNKDKPKAVFPCPTCGKEFGGKPLLIQHIRIHTGEKPFECLDCGKKFARRSDQYVHRRIHTGDRPHACQLCDKKYITKGNLKAHMLTFHKQELK